MVANPTTYTTMTDGFTISAMVANEHILGALYDLNHVDAITRRVDLAGVPSKSHDVGLWPRLSTAPVAEGVDLTATQVNSSKATVTASERGILIIPTDALNLSSLADVMDFAAAAAEALSEEEIGNVAALASSFSNSVGTTTVDLTEANIIAAGATLAANRQRGAKRGLLYTEQWFDYIASVGSSFTPASSTGNSARAETQDFAHSDNGFQRDVFGYEWYTTTAVPTANSGADSDGMLVNPSRAIAHGVKYRSRVEIQRDASLRATEVVVTAFDGVAEIEDGAGVRITTDR